MERNKFALVLLQIYFVLPTHGLDRTLEEFASGNEVVEAVYKKIDSSCIFKNDEELLRRISYVETKDGLAGNTFTSATHKGIWRMDEAMFQTTVNTDQKVLSDIKLKFQIEWMNIKWQDLQIPFYAGLAARLYLQVTTNDRKIPRDVKEQARFWKSFYNPNGNEQEFIDDVASLKKKCNNGLSDLVFLMDSSGSIGMSNFVLMKTFLKDVLQTLNIGPNENSHTRVAVVSYANDVKTEFQLDKYITIEEYIQAIDRIPYMNAWTKTYSALKFLVEEAFKPAFGARPHIKGVPKLGIILTDGISDNPSMTLAEAARAHAAGINLVSIGIGDDVNDNELTAMASEPSCRHKFRLDGFTELDLIKDLIEKQTCEAAINILPDGDVIETQLPVGGIRHCKLEVKKGGSTIMVQPTSNGIVSLYLSKLIYPSHAIYDHKLTADSHYPAVKFLPGPVENDDFTMFCMLEGDKEMEVILNIGNKPGNQDQCEISNPCKNDGKCKNVVNENYECVCPPSFTGRHCEQELILERPTRCSLDKPCHNDGSCVISDSPLGYECKCLPNFTGTNCEIDVSQTFNCHDRNPCTTENISNERFYFSHKIKRKFVQCSKWGHCFEMNCPSGLAWDPVANACTYVQ